MERRNFIKSMAICSPLTVIPFGRVFVDESPDKSLRGNIKISLNAFSFKTPLISGEMTIPDLLDYAAQTGFAGVDLTGYYFPGYPDVPPDEYIYDIKRKAFRLGLEICGTGIKNDFAQPDASAREHEKKMVKDWVEVAAKLGAQTLRIFSGNTVPEGYTWDQVAEWIVTDIRDCAQFAQKFGIVLALQNHNDFLKTAGDVEKILKKINSEWVGLMLDIGCYRKFDPYDEIQKTVQYAVSWQVKEEVYVNNKPVKTDLDKLKKIIDASGFRGYLPIETLGEGDPKQKVDYIYQEVKKRFDNY
jgi:sugar phosphate isomerase/epimerase